MDECRGRDPESEAGDNAIPGPGSPSDQDVASLFPRV